MHISFQKYTYFHSYQYRLMKIHIFWWHILNKNTTMHIFFPNFFLWTNCSGLLLLLVSNSDDCLKFFLQTSLNVVYWIWPFILQKLFFISQECSASSDPDCTSLSCSNNKLLLFSLSDLQVRDHVINLSPIFDDRSPAFPFHPEHQKLSLFSLSSFLGTLDILVGVLCHDLLLSGKEKIDFTILL